MTLIAGDNGQGKTSLLEAVHVLSTTRSFRVPRLNSLPCFGQQSLFVSGTFERAGLKRTSSFGAELSESGVRRELLVNGQKVAASTFVQQLPLFAYSSDLLELVRGGPETRRKFVDRAIAWIEPQHLHDLSRYGRAIRQRNALLEAIGNRKANRGQLAAWDEEIVTFSSPIVRRRSEFVLRLQQTQREISAAHGYHISDLELAYTPATLSPDREDSMSRLRSVVERDLRAGFTTVGPHRDQLEIRSRDRAADEILSSGELKMSVLFLILASIELYQKASNEWPLLLLDDIDAELDLGILQRLIRFLVGKTQLFVTTAKYPILSSIEFGPHRQISMEKGRAAAIAERA